MNATLRLLLVLVTLAWTASQASAVPGRAEVRKVVGTATVSKATGGAPASLAEGMVLGTGDTITTGRNAAVDLYLGLNGDFLRVDADTSLKIDALEIGNIAERTVTTQLSLGKGSVAGNVINKLSRASKFEIKSANGVAGIRGTKYSITTDATGRVTRIVVTQGTVTFLDRGVVVTISAVDGTAKAYTPSQAGQAVSQTVERATAEEAKAVNNAATQTNNSGDGTTTTTIQNPSDVSTSQKD